MERDMDFVRKLLLAIEAAPDGRLTGSALKKPGALPEDIVRLNYHLWLLHNAGLLDGVHTQLLNGNEYWNSLKMTWSGQEFLETIRDAEVWQRTKDGAKKAGNFGLDFIAQLAKAYGKHIAKERLGLDL